MKRIAVIFLVGVIISITLPENMQVAYANTNETVESDTDSEKESIYQEALELVTDSFDYEKAKELLKGIEGYKDSDELRNRYEKMETTRIIDGRFYWQPQEYVQVLKQNLSSLEDDYTNIEITGGTTTPEDGTTDTITISYNDGTVDVLLQNIGFNSNSRADSFGKIKVQGAQGSLLAYPTIVVIATIVNDHSIDSAKEILLKMNDMNPHGEFSQDGFKYIFNNDGTTISFGIEPVGEKIVDENNMPSAKTVQQSSVESEEVENNPKYDKVIKAYFAIKDTLKDPESIKVYGVREYDSDLIFRCTATNGYGGTVTDYFMYSNGGDIVSSSDVGLIKYYYEDSEENIIDWEAVVQYSQGSMYTGTPIE